jgi:hypothetical protein
MRTAKFSVPIDVLLEFLTQLLDMDVSASIIGLEGDEVEIQVEFEKDQAGDVDSLEDTLSDLIDEEDDK